MQFFLTLLAIASLGVHTLVGVHAIQCAICPKSIDGEALSSQCTDKYGSGTTCKYVSSWTTCSYYTTGKRGGGYTGCPESVQTTTSGCQIC
ncbi:hypothetical protein BDN67DRAFT_971496 [Paxillus ammoniavirescens]|nr:hypothetical protein BDN67DRAFT_971496 [Paxillus ammoniavirescens]